MYRNRPNSSDRAVTRSVTGRSRSCQPTPHVLNHPYQNQTPLTQILVPPQVIAEAADQVQILDEEVVYPDQIDDMAESLLPMFTGLDCNASEWLTEFDTYSTYKNLNDATKIAFFKLRMGGIAKCWVNSLAEGEKDTVAHLNTSFRARWFPKEFERHTMVRGLFAIRQERNESVDTYISRILQKAQMCGELAAEVVVDAAQSGLLEGIQAYVIENRPLDRALNLQDILAQGRIAEITRSPVSNNESLLEKQILQLSTDIAQMSTKLNRLSTANVTPRDSSQSPVRRQVSFQDDRRPQQPHERYQRHEPSPQWQQGQSTSRYDDRNQWQPPQSNRDRNSYRGDVKQSPRQPYQGQRHDQQQRWQEPPQTCSRCGRRRHNQGTPCPMMDQKCFSCQATGHSYRKCKNRPMNQQSQQY
jgi:hypothetical protein